jgi:hypothetical protein
MKLIIYDNNSAGQKRKLQSAPGNCSEIIIFNFILGVPWPADTKCPDQLWGPPSVLSNGYRGRFSRGKSRPVRAANNSLPSSAEVKNE